MPPGPGQDALEPIREATNAERSAARQDHGRMDPPALSQPSWYQFNIGDIQATVVSDGMLNLGSATDHFAKADPKAVQTLLADAYQPVAPVIVEQNALILNMGDRLVLFDTGTGGAPIFGAAHGRLMDNLRAAGFDPTAFTDVVLTHAHPDHCFGLVGADGTPNFPSATIHVAQADLDFWTNEALIGAEGMLGLIVGGARRNLLPLRDRIDFVRDGQDVLPGIQAMAAPGHTVGHTCFAISSGQETCLNIGDVAHHTVLSMREPGWAFSFDTDPEQAARSRVRILDMLATDRMRVVGYHFPFPGIGHVSRDGSAFRYVPESLRHG